MGFVLRISKSITFTRSF